MLSKFDEEVKANEEALKKSVETDEEVKEDTKETEEPKEQKDTDVKVDGEEVVSAEPVEAEAKEVGETEGNEEATVEVVESPDKDTEAKEEDTPESETEDDNEDVVESEEDSEEDVEKKLTTVKERKRKQKETVKDKEDSLKDTDKDPKEDGNEKDNGKPRKPKKKDKRKTEQAVKSDEEHSESEEAMKSLLEVVLKSYQTATQAQEEVLAKIESLDASISKLTTKEAIEEETAKSIDVAKVVDDEVEDKAVGYVAKSVTEPVVEAQVEENAPDEVATEEQDTTFNVANDRNKFLSKFREASMDNSVSRASLETYREAYLNATEGRATAKELSTLSQFISE